QHVAGEVYFQVRRFSGAEVAGGVEGVGLRVHPALLVERPARNVALGAADPLEGGVALEHGALDLRISRGHWAGDLKRCLPNCDRGDISTRQLVLESVAVRIGIQAKTLSGLDFVMMVECGVGEFPKRDYVCGLVPGPDDKSRRIV